MTADQIRSLQPALAALLLRFRGCFRTAKTFGHWERYLLGLMTDLKRKSIEPIALAAGVAVRTLQEFLSQFVWDHERVNEQLQQLVADERGANVSESLAPLVVFADRHVLPGLSDRAASGGKIRGSPWSRWPRRRTTWPRRSGTATGVRRLTGPALRYATRIVMRPHMRAAAGRPGERIRDSAVILGRSGIAADTLQEACRCGPMRADG